VFVTHKKRGAMKHITGWLVLLPLGLVLVIMALANREMVKVGFDPVSPQAPLVEPLAMPLFVLIYAVLIAGVLLGGVAAWLAEGRHRRDRRHWRREAARLSAELEALKRERGGDETLALLDATKTE
jgi:uncharacterized integral membrane protein